VFGLWPEARDNREAVEKQRLNLAINRVSRLLHEYGKVATRQFPPESLIGAINRKRARESFPDGKVIV
jgi:hypothetical protein